MEDVVYILKNTRKNPELVYSIRSVVQNFRGHKIVFAGGCPEDLSPDLKIVVDSGKGKWNRARQNILEACKNGNLTEDIILFNDDFFVMKPTAMLPTYTNGEFSQFIQKIEGMTGETPFVKRLKKAYDILVQNNLPTKNYEVHVPMKINRKKMLEVVAKFPQVPCLRSLYGNYFRVPSEEIDSTGQMEDGVQQLKRYGMKKDRLFVSTTDVSFKGKTGRELKMIFTKPTKYEKGFYG